ncbi:hypothetical protein [Verrucosispora sp. WMMC514]|uniref:hypothetical protein n=1 Tax=Verrucosispora sp. WMMC514 TaxID=3015156 RepID=UPI00248D21D8|nr:hypothetical protein [Verrucosispora sp. WMMC514]WBB94121.1 hypothetical protein O7597_14830 [Verrucosispora sp. WMMC514]
MTADTRAVAHLDGDAAKVVNGVTGSGKTPRRVAPGVGLRPDVTSLLDAIDAGRVAHKGGSWVIPVDHLARTVQEAGLAAKVGDGEQSRLRLTRAGEDAMLRAMVERALTRQTVYAAKYREGFAAGQASLAKSQRPAWRRVVSIVGGGLLMFAAGAATAILAAQIGVGQ